MTINSSNLFIIDTETTGMSPLYNRIIEIGILRIENGKIVETFKTLLNPHKSLSPFIEDITGISSEELEEAPEFKDIADKVRELSHDAIFVAHNAAFDYGFLKTEFKRCGIEFTMKQLCTVKLSRLLYPSERRHDLSSIIERHDLKCKSRHRAYDDAKALWDFILSAQKELKKETIDLATQKLLKTGNRPTQLSNDLIDALYEGPGVYIFRDDKDRELYIGKSIHIKERVMSHFQDVYKSGRKRELLQLTKTIESIPCAGELEALIMESDLIKSKMPIYNIKSREKRILLWLEQVTDENGYYSTKLRQTAMDEIDMEKLLGIFKSRQATEEVIRKISSDYLLCNKVMGLERIKKNCFNFELGKCAGACSLEEKPEIYNQRFEIAFKNRKVKKWPYKTPLIIKEQAQDSNRGVGYIIDNWCLVSKIRFDNDIIQEEELNRGFDLETYRLLAKAISGKFKHLTVKPYQLSSI